MACTKVLELMETTGDFQTSTSNAEGKKESLSGEWEFELKFQLIITYSKLNRRVNTKCGDKFRNNQGGVEITSLNPHFPHQKAQHQMLRRKKAEPVTPHFLSLNRDIVACSQ